MRDKIARLRRTGRTGVKACKMLITVRAALPWHVRALVIATLAVKALTAPLPFDGGVDELLIVVTGLILWARHRALLRVCWHAAQLEMR